MEEFDVEEDTEAEIHILIENSLLCCLLLVAVDDYGLSV